METLYVSGNRVINLFDNKGMDAQITDIANESEYKAWVTGSNMACKTPDGVVHVKVRKHFREFEIMTLEQANQLLNVFEVIN